MYNFISRSIFGYELKGGEKVSRIGFLDYSLRASPDAQDFNVLSFSFPMNKAALAFGASVRQAISCLIFIFSWAYCRLIMMGSITAGS